MITREAAARPVVASRVVHGVWGGLLLALTASQLLYGFGSQRPYTSGPSPLLGQPSAGLTSTLTAIAAVVVTGVAAAMIALALPVARWPRHGGRAAVGAALFGSTIVFSAWWHGDGVSLGLLALPLVSVAVATFPRPSLAWFERAAVLVLRVFVWGSLAAAVAAPSWAVKQHGLSVLPGVGTRLAGVTPHPNSLGPLAVALLVLEWRRAPRSRIGVVVATVVLVWTQSKTSWAAAVLVLGIGIVGALRRRSSTGSRVPTLAMLAVLGFSAYVGLGVLGDTEREDRTDTSTETFTGRTSIWEVTLEVWQEDPVLGHGTGLWDDEMDARYAHRVGFPPGHAHNQLMQTLGQAGLVGAVALLGFLVSFARLVQRADGPTRGVSTALFLLLVVRCFSEPPLQSSPHSASFLLLVVTLALALVGANEGVDDA